LMVQLRALRRTPPPSAEAASELSLAEKKDHNQGENHNGNTGDN